MSIFFAMVMGLGGIAHISSPNQCFLIPRVYAIPIRMKSKSCVLFTTKMVSVFQISYKVKSSIRHLIYRGMTLNRTSPSKSLFNDLAGGNGHTQDSIWRGVDLKPLLGSLLDIGPSWLKKDSLHTYDVDVNAKIFGKPSTNIFDYYVRRNLIPITKAGNSPVFNRLFQDNILANYPGATSVLGYDISFTHRSGGASGIFNGFARESNLLIEQKGGQSGDAEPQKRYDNHPPSERRRGFLRSEIALLMILAAGGLWIAYRALNRGGNAGSGEGILLWWLVAMLAVSVGGYCLLLLLIGAV